MTRIKGIGIDKALVLKKTGIKTIEQLANIKIEELSKIAGIEISLAEKWITAAYNILHKNKKY